MANTFQLGDVEHPRAYGLTRARLPTSPSHTPQQAKKARSAAQTRPVHQTKLTYDHPRSLLNNTGTDFASETVPNYFYARNYGPKEYLEFDYPEIGPAYNSWYGLYISEQGTANGDWCVQWAWDKSVDACYEDFPHRSEELQTGNEYATSTGKGAEINGRSVGWTEWTNWTWHEGWYGSYAKAQPYHNSPLCVTAPAAGYTYGSVAFADPGC